MKQPKQPKKRSNLGASLLFWALFILFLPFLLLVLIVAVLYLPIDYIRFRRSQYQKDFPRKYSRWCGTHTDNRTYSMVKKHALPIEY